MLLSEPTLIPIIRPHASLQEALVQMSETEIDCLLVVEAGQFLGWLTAQDVVKLAAQGKLAADCPLRAVMTQPPYILTLKESEKLLVVLQYLQKYRVNQLPIVAEDGELWGLMTAHETRLLYNEQFDYIEHLKQKNELLAVAKTDQDYLLREITNAVTGIIYVYDLEEERNIYSNQSITSLLGYTPSEIYNMGDQLVPMLVHPEDMPNLLAIADIQRSTVAQDDTTWEYEYRTHHADGSWRWLAARNRPFRRHDDGRTKQIIGIAQDITHRKQIELELAASQHFLERITESVPGIIFIYDLVEVNFVYINSHITDITGYTPEEICEFGADLVTQLIHPEDVARMSASPREQLTVHSTTETQYRVKNKQGKWIWILERTVVFQTNPDGSPRQLLGTSLDITDRKVAEEELQKINNELEEIVLSRTQQLQLMNRQLIEEINRKTETEIALRKSEERFQNMVANIPGMVYQGYSDIQGNHSFSYVSDYAQELYDVPLSEAIKSAEYLISLTHPEDIPELYRLITLHLQTLEPLYFLGRITTPAGNLKWIEIKTRPQKQEDGRVLWDGIIMDRTDRELAQAQVRADLQEKEVLLKEIHHRVKNNLQVITSLLSLQSQYIKDPALVSLFQESQSRIYSMALIHEQLCRSTRLDRIDFAEYVRDLATQLHQLYTTSPDLVQLNINVADVFLNIETAVPCGLIINEIIVNALKYAFPKGMTGQITIEVQQLTNQKFSLVIKDNGVGMPDDFDVSTTKTLGLRLVRMLTKQLDGELTVSSHPGTQFSIIFCESHHQQS